MRLVAHVLHTEEKRKANMILMNKSEGYEPVGRSRFRWKDNTKMYLKNRMAGL
jgi:hypothetical protein